MSSEIRPRFKVIVPQTKETVIAHFRDTLDTLDPGVLQGKVVGQHINIRFPKSKQTFWTPEVNINIDTVEEGTEVRGLAGPKPSVWMLFIFFYFFLGVASVFIIIFGISRHQLGMTTGILWLLPVIGVIVAGMYIGARIGQKMAEEQLHFIKKYVRGIFKSLKDKPIN